MSANVDGLSWGCAGLGSNGRSGKRQSVSLAIPRFSVTVTVEFAPLGAGISGCEVAGDNDNISGLILVSLTFWLTIVSAFCCTLHIALS